MNVSTRMAVAGLSVLVAAAGAVFRSQRQLRREVDDLRAEVAAARIAGVLDKDDPVP